MSPKRVRSLSICAPRVAGSAVSPAKTSTATGQPSALHSRPKTICALPRLPSRGVAVARQRAAAALHPGRADVVEHQGAVGEMTPGQAPLDRPLAFQQPVHRRIERVFVDRAQPQLPGQAVAQRVVAQTARGGQLGARGGGCGPRSWPPPGRAGARAWRRSGARARGRAGWRARPRHGRGGWSGRWRRRPRVRRGFGS